MFSLLEEETDTKVFISLYGEIFSIYILPTHTINSVKGLIHDKEGIGKEYQILLLNGKKLEDDKTCEFYNIVNGSKLFLFINEQSLKNDDIKINIKERAHYQNFFINAKPKDTIKIIKEKIHKDHLIYTPIERIKLVYKQMDLKDERTLYSYGIVENLEYSSFRRNNIPEFNIYDAPENSFLINVHSKNEIFNIFIESSQTIKELKERIRYNNEIFSLYSENNKKLENDSTLLDNGISNQTNLTLKFEPKKGIIIIIRSEFERDLYLDVKTSDSILDIKKEIESHIGINVNNQELYTWIKYMRYAMENDKKISDYNIENETDIVLSFKGGKELRIYVKNLDGKTLNLNLNSLYTIDLVKKILKMKEGIDESEQRLVYSGRQLEDHKTLESYNIYNDATFHLVLRLRGG